MILFSYKRNHVTEGQALSVLSFSFTRPSLTKTYKKPVNPRKKSKMKIILTFLIFSSFASAFRFPFSKSLSPYLRYKPSREVNNDEGIISGKVNNDKGIIGGEVVTSSEKYPWVVSIVRNGNLQWCGGSLVAPNVVMTAARNTPYYFYL